MLTGLPKDPILLLSVVNTKLRDEYKNLDALCEDLSVEKEKLMLAILREKNLRR